MSPLIAALVTAAIQSVIEIVSKLQSGQITEAQAAEYLKAAADHYNASVKAWDEAGGAQ